MQLLFNMQVMALDWIAIAVGIASWLESKRLPKGRIYLSKWANAALWTGYIVALQAIIQYLQNFDVLGEVVFGGSSRYRGTFWALKLSAACFAGVQFGVYLRGTLHPGEQKVEYLMSLLEAAQELMNQLDSVDNAESVTQDSADKQRKDVDEASVEVTV